MSFFRSTRLFISVVGFYFAIFGCQGQTNDAATCYEGYLTDTFCLNQDFFLDDPDHQPLVNPELHSALCLLDPPQCRVAYEVLADPVATGANYTRAIRLDENGVGMVIDYATKVGKGCSNCSGTIEMGIRAVVSGSMSGLTSSDGIPIFNVTSIESPTVGCSSTPVTMPSMPVSMPAPVPVAMTTAPVPSPSGSSVVGWHTQTAFWSSMMTSLMIARLLMV